MLTIKDSKILLALAIPLIASGLVEASLGFTSNAFLSHLGTRYLAAGGLVGWFFATMMVIFWGLFTAISVAIANRQGAQDEQVIANIVRDGFWISTILTIPLMLLIWNMAPVLQWLGQDKALVTMAIPYLHALAWSVFPDLVGLLLLQLVIGLGHARTNLVFTLSWVILNIAANYAFIFGHWGAPAMGIAGLGWGTALSFWMSTGAWLVYLLNCWQYRPYFSKIMSHSAPYYYRELIKLGLPIGVMLSIEVSFFFVLLLMIGHINVLLLAASQVAMQYLGLFVSVLFAIAQAVTVRVSNRLGANEPAEIRNAIHSGLVFALSLMLILALCAWLVPEFLISLDFNNKLAENSTVIDHAITFLRIGVAFLLLEAIRITLFGALRGLKDSYSTLIGSLLSFWLIAIPLGYYFAYGLGLSAQGYWWGLLISGFFGASFLWWRYQKRVAGKCQSLESE